MFNSLQCGYIIQQSCAMLLSMPGPLRTPSVHTEMTYGPVFQTRRVICFSYSCMTEQVDNCNNTLQGGVPKMTYLKLCKQTTTWMGKFQTLILAKIIRN